MSRVFLCRTFYRPAITLCPQSFVVAFVGHYLFFLCASVRSCALVCIPVRYRVFGMHPNRPLLDIIFQSCASLCIRCGLELALVLDSPIPWVLNVLGFPLSYILSSCDYTMSDALCTSKNVLVVVISKSENIELYITLAIISLFRRFPCILTSYWHILYILWWNLPDILLS